MASHVCSLDVAAVLGGISGARGLHAQRLLLLVPSLAEGTFRSADVALRPSRGVLAMTLRLQLQVHTARVVQRLTFWLAREGGWCRATEAMDSVEVDRFAASFAACERQVRDVSAEAWADTIRALFTAAAVPAPGGLAAEPELRLHAGGSGWQGFAFDPATGLLQVPCPLAPPVGDVLRLSVDGIAAGRATVVSVRRRAGASSLTPAGFTLALSGLPEQAASLIEHGCRELAARRSTRTSPRYPVIARASLAGPHEEVRYESGEEFLRDYANNLSHGGAFVHTSRRYGIGDRVELHLRLPNDWGMAITGVVVHRTGSGVGLQFELTPDVEASLSAAIAGLAGRPRRVLLVDDDTLAREIVGEAFTTRGFEVITASSGEAGLRAITDELFALDAVVTDYLMPGLSGEALVSAVRTAGGEADLVLVVVSGSVEPDLRARLALAGADRVLSKSEGTEKVVAAVEEAMASRAAPPVNDDPFLRARREQVQASTG